jgi:GATA-binding protein
MNGHSEGSNSPISRTVTPSMYHIPTFNNHPFDGYPHPQHSPSLPAMNLRQPSPGRSASPLNGVNGLELPQTYEQLIAQNAAFKTRVSELEVINELFRGRVTELEQDASNAKRGVDHLQRQLEESQRRENLLKRRLDDMVEEHQTDGGDGPPRAKKIRVSDMIGDSEASTPST